MNKTKIPSNIDVSKIINKVEELYNGTKSKTEIVNIKDCSFLLIHFLIPDSKYLEETKHDNYFKKIFSTIFNEKYGKTFSDVKAVLFDDAYPVIETDGTNYTDNRSTRYKLKDEFFFNQATKLVEGTGKYIQKYNNYVKDKKQKNNQFQFLSDRLSKRITLDSAVYSYMSQLLTSLKPLLQQ